MMTTLNGTSYLATVANQTAVGGFNLARNTYSFAVDTGAQAAYTQFTVTGTVLVQMVAVCTTLMNSGGAATIELGIAGNTAALIAQTTATDLDQYEAWQDATPEANPAAVDLTARTFVIANGADIILTVGGADLTAGVIDFYCLWSPLSAGAMVV